MSQSDGEYFEARGRAERELSERSTDPLVAAIHAKMADCYEKLAREEAAERRPILRIVTA